MIEHGMSDTDVAVNAAPSQSPPTAACAGRMPARPVGVSGAGFDACSRADRVRATADDDDRRPSHHAPRGGDPSSAGKGKRAGPRDPERRSRAWQLEGHDGSGGSKLFSGTFMRYEAGSVVTCFVAALASDARECRARIFERYGAATALGASIRAGFDPYDRLTFKLISEDAANYLSEVVAQPERASAKGFVVVVEHRVPA